MEKKRFIILIVFICIFLSSILLSFFYSKNKYIVSFETGTSDIILNQYISKDGIIQVPITPIKDGYIFKEWQLNGKKFDFSTKVDSDIILTAKWVKEEYVEVSFNTKSEYIIDSIKILKGDIITDLPIPKKEDYEFIGWYLNDSKYDNQEIYSDSILIAEYKNDTINPTYKVGDSVKITGSYSNKSMSNFAYNKRAIGWYRKILRIYEGAIYPYMVGNDTGVTGFFKAESIEKY